MGMWKSGFSSIRRDSLRLLLRSERRLVREEGLTHPLRGIGALPQIFDLPFSARRLASSNPLGFSSLLGDVCRVVSLTVGARIPGK